MNKANVNSTTTLQVTDVQRREDGTIVCVRLDGSTLVIPPPVAPPEPEPEPELTPLDILVQAHYDRHRAKRKEKEEAKKAEEVKVVEDFSTPLISIFPFLGEPSIVAGDVEWAGCWDSEDPPPLARGESVATSDSSGPWRSDARLTVSYPAVGESDLEQLSEAFPRFTVRLSLAMQRWAHRGGRRASPLESRFEKLKVLAEQKVDKFFKAQRQGITAAEAEKDRRLSVVPPMPCAKEIQALVDQAEPLVRSFVFEKKLALLADIKADIRAQEDVIAAIEKELASLQEDQA